MTSENLCQVQVGMPGPLNGFPDLLGNQVEQIFWRITVRICGFNKRQYFLR